jgi:RHH-type rel operon transcriptional repressor/antitoxin RelB
MAETRGKGSAMPTSVRLPKQTEERLSRLASRTGRSKAFYINEAIESALDRLEYEYGILGDIEDYRAGRMRTYTLEEARGVLGLEG